MFYKNIICLLIIFWPVVLFAQPPQAVNYQTVIRSSDGNLFINQNVSFRFSILQDSSTAAPVYVETQTATTNNFGLVSFAIGNGTVLNGNFATINWLQGPYFLKTELDSTGGNNYRLMGITQLLSVPYALHAKTADSLIGGGGCFTHAIGDLYGGGIIYYLWKTAGVEHGLIASLADLGDSIVWETGAATTATGAASFDNGAANTALVVSLFGPGTDYAAGLCHAYNAGGYTDWYLPAIWELNRLYDQAFVVNTVLNNDNDSTTNGFNNLASYGLYWSSTEDVQNFAWYQFFGNNNETGSNYAYFKYRVRAIRRF